MDAHSIETDAHVKPLRVIIDIETIGATGPLRKYASSKFERTISAPKNYKDPEKIQAFIQKALTAKMDRLALEIPFAEILCIGIRTSEGEARCFSRWTHQNEFSLLEAFLDWVEETEERGYLIQWAGKGIKRYDFPIIRTRIIAHDFMSSCHRQFRFYRYETDKVVDLEDTHYWPHDGRRGPSLDDMCAIICLPGPEGRGSQVAGWWALGSFDLIEEHCMSDLHAIEQILSALGE